MGHAVVIRKRQKPPEEVAHEKRCNDPCPGQADKVRCDLEAGHKGAHQCYVTLEWGP